MSRSLLLAGLGILIIAGAAAFGWAAGKHWPCETLGRLGSESVCSRILALEGRNLQGMDRLPNGNILSGARGPGPKPDTPLSLMEIDAASGRIVADTPLTQPYWIEAANAGPSAPSFSRIAVSADGNLVAITALGMKTTIVDRQGNPKAVIDRSLPAFMAFDDQGRFLLEMGRNSSGIPEMDRTQVFDPADPTAEPVALTGKPPPGMFAQGVTTVLSGDGWFYAHAIPTMRDSGIAGVRVGPSNNRAAPGMLLAAKLREGCSYALPRLAFSPDTRKLAAAFDCSPRLGTESSALIVWDLEGRQTLARIPTAMPWSSMLWLDDETLVVERYDPDRKLGELFKIRLAARH